MWKHSLLGWNKTCLLKTFRGIHIVNLNPRICCDSEVVGSDLRCIKNQPEQFRAYAPLCYCTLQAVSML